MLQFLVDAFGDQLFPIAEQSVLLNVIRRLQDKKACQAGRKRVTRVTYSRGKQDGSAIWRGSWSLTKREGQHIDCLNSSLRWRL